MTLPSDGAVDMSMPLTLDWDDMADVDGYRIVVDNVEDLTPPEEIERVKMMRDINYENRDRGLGRPTKKERRLLDQLKKRKHF